MSDPNDQNESVAEDSRLTLATAIAEIWRIAMPLMISTGMFSLVLFADRTFLLWYDGSSMSASMASGNLFWVLICLPVGIASMTGAIISQYVGSKQESKVGKFLWQSVWISIAWAPWFALVAWLAPDIFRAAGQEDSLIAAESIYLRILMAGAVGNVMETSLSGFFSGTERTRVIMWVSVAAALINFSLDLVLIFGIGPIPSFGIAGAASASSLSFWFKAVCYATILFRSSSQLRYRFVAGFGFDWKMIRKLLFFGVPTGLMYLTEAGAFTIIILRLGSLGDLPLRATTMAINFNMIAFIPLIGVSIAASVLVGRHLMETGPRIAKVCVRAALVIGLAYSSVWMIAYLTIGDWMMELYRLAGNHEGSYEAAVAATGLLGFVAAYVVLDAVQLIIAGALRGAGDTWFVLFGGLTVSAIAIGVGFVFEPEILFDPERLGSANSSELQSGRSGAEIGLTWWWSVMTGWIFLLVAAMVGRYLSGQWQNKTMV